MATVILRDVKKSFGKTDVIHGINVKWQCHICGKAMNDGGHLARHVKKHKNIRDYQCSFCPFNSGSLASLTRHLQCHVAKAEASEKKARENRDKYLKRCSTTNQPLSI